MPASSINPITASIEANFEPLKSPLKRSLWATPGAFGGREGRKCRPRSNLWKKKIFALWENPLLGSKRGKKAQKGLLRGGLGLPRYEGGLSPTLYLLLAKKTWSCLPDSPSKIEHYKKCAMDPPEKAVFSGFWRDFRCKKVSSFVYSRFVPDWYLVFLFGFLIKRN